MKFSLMSYTFGRTGWFKDNPVQGMQRMCRFGQELGVDGVDMVTTHGLKAREARKILDDHGLRTVCHTFSAGGLARDSHGERCAAVDAARAGMEDAVILGTDKVMLVTPGKDKDGLPRDIARRNYIRGLQECAVCARQNCLTMTIENFPGAASPFVISSDVLEAIREVSGLKLTYDNGNIFMGGEDPAVSFTRCAEHVAHAHFKDWDLMPAGEGREGLDGRRYQSALIGEGVLDHKACLAAMQAAGYQGYINIEYENNKYPADEATKLAVRYLQELMQQL
ncbi:MAG: sugar phosphate isomerase/epimerase family protein [Kiritimatiellia bacterium]|nr:sugar phosphate isomerase/epimerase [Lentisphaerota bacterium]